MNKRATITAAALIGTAGLGVGAAQLAMADPSSSPSTSSSPSSSSSSSSSSSGSSSTGTDKGDRPDGPRGGHGGRGFAGVDSAALAKQLGLDESKVTAAVKTASESVRDSSTQPDKSATEAEREAARAAQQKKFVTALAKELGVTEAKVTSAIEAVQAAHKAEGLTALKTKLDAAVKAGTLTQAEADAVVKAYNAGVVQGVGGPRR